MYLWIIAYLRHGYATHFEVIRLLLCGNQYYISLRIYSIIIILTRLIIVIALLVTLPNKRICLVFDEKSTVVSEINQGCRKTFLPKTLLFHEDCASSDLSQDPSDKLATYEIWNYSLGSTLQFALFKIKIRLLESYKKGLRHGSSIKPHLSLCKRDNTTKKILFWRNKFTMEHWTS